MAHGNPSSLLDFERDLLSRGIARAAGIDEVGRGPLAGPVAAAAVVLPPDWIRAGLPPELHGLTDSKRLAPARRERFAAFLLACPHVQQAVVFVEVGEIDRLNILRATQVAMRRAIAVLAPAPQHLLVDGLPVPDLPAPQTALVGGDARSASIAAASVLAKVARDRRMNDYDRTWPDYGFAEHKGYPTARHRAVLARLGPCPIHRRSFAPVRDHPVLPLAP
ncbi:MAG: ribonuclease HII [Verrucomicrobiae bacterium]|nr:ribonuclease HII [Verrucomicrobiae bacterium]